MDRSNAEWIQAREQSIAAYRDSGKELAAMYKGLRDEGLGLIEAAIIVGVYQGHLLAMLAKERGDLS